MKYYNENGEVLTETPDLSKGYLEPREYEYVEATPAVTHKEVKMLPSGRELIYTVIDKEAEPGYNTIVSYTYYKYVDHPTLEMRVGAAENAITEMAMEVYQ